MLLTFDMKGQRRYLMFLKKGADGRYESTTGPTDPAIWQPLGPRVRVVRAPSLTASLRAIRHHPGHDPHRNAAVRRPCDIRPR